MNHKKITSIRLPFIPLILMGLALGILLTALCWLFPESATNLFTGRPWLVAVSLAGAVLLLVSFLLAQRKSYPAPKKLVLLLAVSAATLIVYLFPELLAPGCNGMPRAFAACPAACRITVCSNWDAPGENGCNPPPGALGCCVSYETTCDPDCDEPDPDPTPIPILPPTVSGSVSCVLPGTSGWCRNGAVLNLSASDPQGYATTISGDIAGVAFSCAGPTCTRSLPVGSGTIHYQASSPASGQSSGVGSASFAYDPTPPTAVVVTTGTPGANGWYLSAVVSATGTDAASGVSSAQVSVDGGAWRASASLIEGTHSIIGRSIDNAGNTSITAAQIVKVDATAPTISAAVTSGTLVAGWYVTDVTLTAIASDATSSVALIEHRLDGGAWSAGDSLTVSAQGPHTVDFRATDQAGLRSTTSLHFQVDKTPPAVSFTPIGTPGANGWYTSLVALSISAEDALSGVAGIEYRLDGGAWISGSSLTLSDGEHTVEARATDRAGNLSAVTPATTIGIQVDTTAPTLSLALTGTLGKNDWYVSDVTIIAAASDVTSGIDLSEYSLDGGDWSPGSRVTISTDGPHSVRFRVIDRAGNQASDFRTFKIDQTRPLSAFVVPLEGSSGTLARGSFRLEGQSSDAISGLASVQISTDNGSTWTVLATTLTGGWQYNWDTRPHPNNLYPVLARTEDLAGNVESGAHVMLLLANQPPKVSIQESWWIWEAGNLAVSQRFIPIAEIRVRIGCLDGQPDVRLSFTPESLPESLSWDRKCGEGQFATSGDHPVTLTACDQVGNCASAQGMIKVPFIAPPIPTWTPAVTPTPTATLKPTRTVRQPQPTPTMLVALTPVEKPVPTPAPQPEKLPTWFWAALTLVGFLMALTAASLADPRRRALRRLKKVMSEVRHGPQ
jgi:hypothetical protein